MKKLLELRLLFSKPHDRAKIIRKAGVFYHFGENAYFHPWRLPSEPWLVSLGDNNVIAADVSFVTHDMFHRNFNYFDKSTQYHMHYGKIEIGNNVSIGARSIIMYGVKIGDNVIIGGGSIVTKDIPSNSVAAGVPAKVIGSFSDLLEKRKKDEESQLYKMSKKEMADYFWK